MIRHRLQQRLIVEFLKQRREDQHVNVMEKSKCLAEKVLTEEVEGRKPQGCSPALLPLLDPAFF